MARGDKKQQSELMMRAAESGQAGVRRAHEGLIAQEAQGRRDLAEQGARVGQLAEEGERRQLQEREAAAERKFRAGESKTEREFRAGENAAEREFRAGEGAAEREFRAGEGAAEREFRAGESKTEREFHAGESETERRFRAGESAAQRETTERMAAEDRRVREGINRDEFRLRERGQRIDAADRGLEGVDEMQSSLGAQGAAEPEGPPAAPGGAGSLPPLDPQSQQRLGQQTQKPLEHVGAQGYAPQDIRPSARRRSMEEREVRLKQQQLELNDQRIALNKLEYENLKNKPPSKERDEAMLKSLDHMAKAIESTQDEISKVITGQEDWQTIAEAYASNPQIAQAMQGGQLTKARVVEMMRTQLGTQQLSYMAASGQMPPGFDPSNPVMRQFNARFQEVAAVFRGTQEMDLSQGDAFDQAWEAQDHQGLAGAWAGVQSVKERNELLTRITARVMTEADAYRMRQDALLKASGFQELIAEKDARIASLLTELQASQERERLLGGAAKQRASADEQAEMDEELRSEQRGRSGGASNQPPRFPQLGNY